MRVRARVMVRGKVRGRGRGRGRGRARATAIVPAPVALSDLGVSAGRFLLALSRARRLHGSHCA